MQEGFRYKTNEKIIPNIKKLIKQFKGKIIFTKFQNKKNSHFEKILNWKKFQNKKDQEVMTELKELVKETITHTNYTVLNTALKKYIKLHKINEITICGIYTDVCIIKTTMDLFDVKILVKVVENATITQYNNDQNQTLKSIRRIIGKENVIKI